MSELNRKITQNFIMKPEHELRKMVFLLGGADLEMAVIKTILEQYRIEYHTVDGMSWSDAKLSKYSDRLKELTSPDVTVYGIELETDMSEPDNYICIDHHGDVESGPSSLEQVAELIGHELSPKERLVAANDKGFFPEMKKWLERMDDLSKKELTQELFDTRNGRSDMDLMLEIRRMDRQSQGVSDEEERQADDAVRMAVKGNSLIAVVRTETEHFSPVTDRMYPYHRHRLVVYNGSELAYYGKDRDLALNHVLNMELVKKDQCYKGGGKEGFWGIKKGSLKPEQLEAVANHLMNKYIHESYHIFYYPFTWRLEDHSDDDLSSQVDLGQLWIKKDSGWKRHAKQSEDDLKEIFNEKNYFFKFVHGVLYDDKDESKPHLMHHYERVVQGTTYELQVKYSDNVDIKYSLKVDAVNLNLYSTGVGLLSFYLHNDDGKCFEGKDERDIDSQDVLRINQFGRRIMPPFYADIEHRNELAKSIGIKGLPGFEDEQLYENFGAYTLNDSWKPACFVTALLDDLATNLETSPVIDDRMYVMSWYKNGDALEQVCKDTVNYEHEDNNHFWYRYIFVDSSDPTCQNGDMRKGLLEQATYKRWQDWGSMYGMSRYSLVLLTNEYVPDYLLVYFRTIYARMVELTLMQRASLLSFSKEVTAVSNLSDFKGTGDRLYGRIKSVYEEYIRFVNQFYYRDVTAQDQGIELYGMLHGVLKMDESVKDLDEDIVELYQYISMVDDNERNKKADTLNWIMGFFAPASLVAGIWGMNEMCDVCTSGTFWPQMAWIAGVSGLVMLGLWLKNRKTRK